MKVCTLTWLFLSLLGRKDFYYVTSHDGTTIDTIRAEIQFHGFDECDNTPVFTFDFEYFTSLSISFLVMLLGTVLLLKQILVFFSSPPHSVVYQKCQILSSNSTFIYNDMEAGHEDLFATCDDFIEEGVVYDYEYLSFLILLFTDTPLPVHSFLL